MGVFQIPKENIINFNRLILDFWWGKVDNRRRVCWISLDDLCLPKSKGGLGFKNFSNFNQALLARQAWRILSEPDSLLAQILRGRYFHKTSFLNAVLGSRPSWGWRSILHGRDLLIKGLRFQIGQGFSIRALSDPWIPSFPPTTPRLHPSISNDYSNLSVASLIYNHQWDIPILNNLFIHEDVKLITSIPLPTNPIEDNIIWQYAPSGAYTVQSGYSLLRSIKYPPMLEPISLIDPQLWNQIWSLQVPPKLSFFLWRIFHKILPTKVALLTKKIVTDTICPVCLAGEESIEHIFLLCPLAIRLYSMVDLPYQTIHNSSIIITWRKTWQQNSDLAIHYLILWWRIWKSRNKVVFDYSQIHPMVLLEQYKYQLSELKHLQAPPAPALIPPFRSNNIWQPPSPGRIKINVDGAIKMPFGGAISFVIRDATSNIMSAAGRSFQGIIDPFSIEALAFREAIYWCARSHIIYIDLEGDALSVIQRILDKRSLHPLAGAIIEEVRSTLKQLPNVKLIHIGRQGNKVAHSLAKFSLSFLPASSELHNLTTVALSSAF
ncbi:Uncharacterized mitochondrial protein AtMg00310 [Linum grandiflorum]